MSNPQHGAIGTGRANQYRRVHADHVCPECGASVSADLIVGLTDPDPVVLFPHDPVTGKHPPQISGDSEAARARRDSVVLDQHTSVLHD